ncbi:MAG TPA: ABC transporter ATP-binding protein [Pyrinomonadaceae bacterium]|jgi:ABC-type branched-subunit amino acid transport system ATPase component|nr:ABC transporter ATP-binding protein [Pyrinomonadaceae bacterium]
MQISSLRCERLKKSFDGIQALDGVSLQFAQSRITAIIGPNGAGKSTLLNVMTGFLKPDAGKCYVGDRETTLLAPHRIARLGLARTFQDLRLIFQVSAFDNVMMARANQHGETLLGALFRIAVAKEEAANREATLGLLDLVGLHEQIDEPAGKLSYGQQKLLSLACCLATEAKILWLDEPVAGVHPAMASKILALMRKLRDDGKLIVFIEHDISAVREVAESVVVMDHGRVKAQGAPEEVLGRHEVMEAYLA